MNQSEEPSNNAGANRNPRNQIKASYGLLGNEFGASETRGGEIRLILPYPPSANRYWRKTKTGRVYVSAEAVAYRNEVKWIARQVIKKPLVGPIRLVLHVFRPQRSGDLMNREKILSDALQGIVFVNDGQISEAHLFLHDDKTKPRVEVTLTALFDVK